MKNKKLLFILLLLICMIITTGCKTKTEQIIEDMSNIKITVDEEQVKKTKDAIEEVQRQLKGD